MGCLISLPMKYYEIILSCEPRVIGVKNGIYQININENHMETDNGNYLAFKNFFNYNNKDFWKNQDEIKLLNPPLIKGNLLKNAKVTDIMGYAPEYTFLTYVFSEKYFEIIKGFKTIDFKEFEFEIINLNTKFYLVYFKKVTLQEINFNKSIIFTGRKVLKNEKYHSIENFDEYSQFIKTNPINSFEKIAIPKKYYGKDIIPIQAAGGDFYSERLIDFLFDCKITGLEVNYNNSIQLEFV
ncbi:hypothetical protein CLV50_0643 [Flavobacterium lindanitolerans]|uniref:Immunity protein 43 of polymorphic toxin system n=2 Tax=Flavobacterium lindanitolerans TaxID=428988 RepID=A0A497V3H6_9FLAO|nr:hypothetical protein B0G92_0862 [Flavobacterium lindanitolerans]RLJ35268.1 hypothetical protein CLV50_0643 [Flavobacterium lindanitolerans]